MGQLWWQLPTDSRSRNSGRGPPTGVLALDLTWSICLLTSALTVFLAAVPAERRPIIALLLLLFACSCGAGNCCSPRREQAEPTLKTNFFDTVAFTEKLLPLVRK